MIEVIPAIMPNSYNDLLDKAGRVRGVVSCAQIDVMDGVFVPSVSWPYNKDGVSQFVSMVTRGDMLPFWDELDYEIDLMVEHPEHVVHNWIKLGARRIIVHLESIQTPKEITTLLEARFLDEEDFTGVPPVEFGIALGMESSFDTLMRYIYDVDVVQLMGIKKIGYQGQPFEESVIERIERLRKEYPHLIISVDGGVNLKTAPKLIKAGATRLVSGSVIFKSHDIRGTIFKLKQN